MDRVQFLAATLPAGDAWLDACTPFVDPVLARLGRRLTTVDLEPREPGVKRTDLRIHDPSLGTFDVVTSTDTLEHIDDYAAAIRNLRAYCKGACVIGIPSLWSDAEEHSRLDPATHPHKHEWYFAPKKLERELIAAGFRVSSRYLANDLDIHQVCCFWFMVVA